MKLMTVILGSLLFSQLTFASILEVNPGTKTCNGRNVPQGATVNFLGEKTQVTTVGDGLRTKLIVKKIPVYCFQVLVSEPQKFAKASGQGWAIPQLADMSLVVLRLDFLRAVPAESVSNAYREAVSVNHFDFDGGIKSFLTVASNAGLAESGKSIVIALNLKTGKVLYEGTDDKASELNLEVNTMKQILAIWFGVPSDSGIAALQKQVLGE